MGRIVSAMVGGFVLAASVAVVPAPPAAAASSVVVPPAGSLSWSRSGSGPLYLNPGQVYAFDGVRGVMVAFRACNATPVTNVFNASDGWAPLPAVGQPTPRCGEIMVWDKVLKKVILFGGRDPDSGAFLNDTWAFDGSTMTWTKLAPPNSPSGRSNMAATYDNARGRLALFGGVNANGVRGDTWT